MVTYHPSQESSSSSPPQQNPSEWVCQYANYNFTATVFSNNASVRAIAFGSYVTLWGHRNDVRLITTLRHGEHYIVRHQSDGNDRTNLHLLLRPTINQMENEAAIEACGVFEA